MGLGLIGKKIGMSRFFDLKGNSVPVTLINVFNNYICMKKKIIHNSFQIVFGLKNIFNLNNSLFNHYVKHNIFFFGLLKEFRISLYDMNRFYSGDLIPINIFFVNQYVTLTSRSIGKGFSGVVKRFNFKAGSSTHGNSKSHNIPGSIGMSQDPGRVFLGKKMPGHLGNNFCSIKKLKILKIDFNKNIFYIKGSVSGCSNSFIFITPDNI